MNNLDYNAQLEYYQSLEPIYAKMNLENERLKHEILELKGRLFQFELGEDDDHNRSCDHALHSKVDNIINMISMMNINIVTAMTSKSDAVLQSIEKKVNAAEGDDLQRRFICCVVIGILIIMLCAKLMGY